MESRINIFQITAKSASENVYKRIIVIYFKWRWYPIAAVLRKKEEFVMLANQRRCDT